MKFTAKQISEILKGQVEGDPEASIHTVSRIEEATEGALSFLANPKYTQFIYSTGASIVIVNEDFKPEKEIQPTLIRVPDAYSGLAKVLEAYDQMKKNRKGISGKAYVSEQATIGKDVYIGEFVVIEDNVIIGDRVKIYPNTYIGNNSHIGDDTTIYSGVRIYSDTRIGKSCTLHSGIVLGSDGFGFAPQQNNNYKKVSQIGNVMLEDNVEIGANTTIDRATLGSTIIRKGAKLDNLIQIAHNVEIGENTVIAAQVGISGSTKIGRNCMIGGQVGITGHLKIADEVKIGAQSGISSNILQKGKIVLGSPAFDISKYKKSYVHFRNLEKLAERIEQLEKKLPDKG